jgi:hypothetical protein
VLLPFQFFGVVFDHFLSVLDFILGDFMKAPEAIVLVLRFQHREMFFLIAARHTDDQSGAGAVITATFGYFWPSASMMAMSFNKLFSLLWQNKKITFTSVKN